MQTRSQTRLQTTTVTNDKVKHPKGWTKNDHYMPLGGQCGQSCP